MVKAAEFRRCVEGSSPAPANVIRHPVALLEIIQVLMPGENTTDQAMVSREKLMQLVARRRILVERGTDAAIGWKQRAMKEQKNIGLCAVLELLLEPVELF